MTAEQETPPGGGLGGNAAAMARAGVWTEEQLVADVDAAPPGPRVGAFFDFDGTVIDGYSLAAFARHHLRSLEVTPAAMGQLLLNGLRGVTSEEDFERFTVAGMRAWAGRSEDELVELGERLFVQGIAGSLFPEAWRLVTAHLQAGHTVVLASSATRFQVEPAARALGVEHVLVSPVEIVDGVCTGRPGGPLLWRQGKAAAVRSFAEEHGIDLLQSYAYSNGDEDVPFLRTVGRARALNPGRGLAAAARHYSWPVARFRRRGTTSPVDLARTVAGVGGLFGGFATGLAVGALSGSRREAVDLGITLAGELGSALAGVRLDVQGAEHLATRPAVFLFNHQSQLDVLVLAKLLRGGFTGVAKKELAKTPGFGLAFRLADVAFVDRGDPAQARKALEPAVERLREGISLVIAPEGTRSATPTLGAFKKGAFHVAMQAGVPIVPIVLRNTGELMWRGATTIHPGVVQVRVLPPVPTDGWTAEDLDARVAEVHDSYLRTLANWSGRAERPVVSEEPTAEAGPPVPAPPLDWGSAPEMNPLETAMWRAEAADPRLRANVALLELLDPAPDWERLRAAHEWASRMVPRMRQRVVEPALGIGTPRWATVAELDLDAHVRHVHLEEPGSMRQLLDVVGEFVSAPLDRDRPLWQAMLVEGLSDGRAGYVVKTHHSTTDGLGAVQLMSRLHSRTAEHDPARPEPPVPTPDDDVSRTALLAEQLVGTARSAPLALLRRGAGALGSAAHPWDAVSSALGTARAAGRTLAPPGPGSALLTPRGGGWHLEVLEVPLADLKAGAKAVGGSLNDGFLAAMVGGFRRYHQRHGAPLGTLTVGIPISLRAQDAPEGGNRFTGARFPAPLDEADPAVRIRTIREFVLSVRGDGGGAGVVSDLLAPTLSWLPAPVIGAVSGQLTSANDVQISNVPGVTHPVYIAGSRIERMYPFGPLPGCAAMITLLSHEGQCCIGVNVDAAAITDPAGLVADLQAGLDEVVALGR
ncbi:wax ester/triacylglycerol synthase family O-acyltransferase [Geodermatophilus sp. URMC 62]|uniref:wax ester/triacylglycerol synthase family O-acyltransferase n=1 Tax=Geodermatophilus sp. URMC 62 TaxID=3423414 RepID=UPI00406C2120